MKDHADPISALTAVFVVANLVITIGYLATPVLVLRYLPLTRTVLFFGAMFFLGCAGTHVGMALLIHGEIGWFWTVEHVIQAIGTWGFILSFHAMLRDAGHRRAGATVRPPDAPADRLADPGGG